MGLWGTTAASEILLDGTDGSSSNAGSKVVLNGTDSSSSNAGDRILQEQTGEEAKPKKTRKKKRNCLLIWWFVMVTIGSQNTLNTLENLQENFYILISLKRPLRLKTSECLSLEVEIQLVM